MRRLRPFLLPLGIIVLMLALVIVFGARRPAQDPVRDHSVVRANPWGAKALAELLREHGVKASAWVRPLSLLTDRQRLVCLLDPTRPPPSWELRKLLEWVRAGGTLLVGVDLDDTHDAFAFTGGGADPNEEVLAALGLVAEELSAATNLATPAARRPETREVRAVHVPGKHRVRRAKPGELDERNRALREKEAKRRPRRALVSLPWETLLADRAGAVALTANYDRGRVYVLSEVEVLANENLAKNDNVIFAANILCAPGAPTVYFDEHLHQVRPGMSAEAAELDPARAYLVLKLALLAVVLYLLGQAVRFGAPTPLRERPRRSALEFVDAMADLYRRAEARAAILGILRQTFRHRLATTVGVSPETGGPALAAAVARQRPVGEVELAGLLARLDDPVVATGLTEAELMKLARSIAAFEEAVTHGR